MLPAVSKTDDAGVRQVTPVQTTLVGMAVLVAGALLSGVAHYTGTAKQLAEEGVEARARMRAVPLAARALAASTLVCAGMGVAAVAGWQLMGMQTREVTEVATFADAIALARQQRELVRKEMRVAVFGEGDESRSNKCP